MKKNLLFVLLLMLFASCVPNKDLIYLQGKPINKKEIHKINDAPYKLRVNDILTIDIKSVNPDLVKLFQVNGASNTNNNNSGQGFSGGGAYYSGYSINNHGNIRLPYLGNINVLGYTVVEVRKKIEDSLLEKFFNNKEDLFVTVKLAGIKYTVMGEIGSPGPKVIFQNQVSILDALTNAGDITTIGNRKKVEVIRFSVNGAEKYIIDLTKINALNSEIFYIKPNDYINVPPLRQKAWGTGTTGLQSLTTFVSIFSLVTSTILLVRNL